MTPSVNNRAKSRDTTCARLRQAYIARQRRQKIEIAAVGLLWLIGCPILCSLSATGTGSTWGTRHSSGHRDLCGLLQYSVSASMTGLYPKAFGSVMATLFGLLVVQRSTNGLCSILKLGWLSRFSPLVRVHHPGSTKRGESNALALKLWRRIGWIELLGYLAGGFLVGLVAFDAKFFPGVHDLLATLAFTSLNVQNGLIGWLGQDFPELFPDWASAYAYRVYMLGLLHLTVMFVLFFVLGGKDCEDFWASTESVSTRAFGDPIAIRRLASVALWYNEYAYGLLCIYLQLLNHYEQKVFEFVGESSMPYVIILSRFSISGAAATMTGGGSRSQQISEVPVDLFLGKSSSCEDRVEAERQKIKAG